MGVSTELDAMEVPETNVGLLLTVDAITVCNC